MLGLYNNIKRSLLIFESKKKEGINLETQQSDIKEAQYFNTSLNEC